MLIFLKEFKGNNVLLTSSVFPCLCVQVFMSLITGTLEHIEHEHAHSHFHLKSDKL